MAMASVRAAMTTLLAVCALSAATEAIFDDGRLGAAVRVICGLSIALCAVRLVGSVLR